MPPGKPPLRLFTTLARDLRLCGKFFAAGLLERGHLTLRQREIVIGRTTALCRSEYEWACTSRSSAHVSASRRRKTNALRLPLEPEAVRFPRATRAAYAAPSSK